ncbi:MgtC/SapB family protein [Companilactobacillus hulinensis]|uniref:MgtC/SapB family protein n=1 Tax=Companilactobacillus hulinensis TaxID=2486007 RepID=UPI000F780DDD
MSLHLDILTVTIRLLLATLMSGVIGWDRAHKHRPAGIRTHILVCLGACIIAMIQKEIGFDAIEMARAFPAYKGVIRADEARLIAQVVSGIGFLGAGTIIVEHHSIKGLTTAASLWVVACIGLAVGMGNYLIAVASFVVVYGVVAFLKRIVRVNPLKKIEIQYLDKNKGKKFIMGYFKENSISISNVNFRANKALDGSYTYTNVYEIKLPHNMKYTDVVEGISAGDNITKVQLINLG